MPNTVPGAQFSPSGECWWCQTQFPDVSTLGPDALRERLAADIHDSVLQVLAYVRRRGHEAGGEAAEIAEHFQWTGAGDTAALSDEKRQAVALEIGDTFLYLLRLADRLGIDIAAAANTGDSSAPKAG